LGGTRAITRTKYGAKLFFDTRDLSVGIPLALDGDYEPGLNPWMIGMRRTGDIAIEVGAILASTPSTSLRALDPGGHVYAFEPNPDLFELLRDSVAINYLEDRCTLSTSAVTDHEGEASFGVPTRHLGKRIAGGDRAPRRALRADYRARHDPRRHVQRTGAPDSPPSYRRGIS